MDAPLFIKQHAYLALRLIPADILTVLENITSAKETNVYLLRVFTATHKHTYPP